MSDCWPHIFSFLLYIVFPLLLLNIIIKWCALALAEVSPYHCHHLNLNNKLILLVCPEHVKHLIFIYPIQSTDVGILIRIKTTVPIFCFSVEQYSSTVIYYNNIFFLLFLFSMFKHGRNSFLSNLWCKTYNLPSC